MLPSNYKCADCNSLLFSDIINKNDDAIEIKFGCSCKTKQIQMNLVEFLPFINTSIQIFSHEKFKSNEKLYFCLDCKHYFINKEDENIKHLNHKTIHLIYTNSKCKCNSEDLKFYCKELNKYFCPKCVNNKFYKNYSCERISQNQVLLSSLKVIILIAKEFLHQLNNIKTEINSKMKIFDNIITKIETLSSNISQFEKQLREQDRFNVFTILNFLENKSFQTYFSDLTLLSIPKFLSRFTQEIISLQQNICLDKEKSSLDYSSYLTYTRDKINNKLYLGTIDGNVNIINSPTYNNFTPQPFLHKVFDKAITCITPYNKNYFLVSSIEPTIKLFNDKSQLIQSFDNHLIQVNKIITYENCFYSCSDDCKVFEYKQIENESESNNSQLSFNIKEIITHDDGIVSICFVKENNIPKYIVSSSCGDDDSCVKFYNVNNNELPIKLDNCYCCYRNSLISIDTKQKVLAGGYNELFIIESNEQKLIAVIKNEVNFEYILWMEYGDEKENEILCGSSNGKVICIDANENKMNVIENKENEKQAIYYCDIFKTKIINVGIKKGIFNYFTLAKD
jgi:hypothetical protein